MQKIKTIQFDLQKILQTHKNYCIEQLNILRNQNNSLPQLSEYEINQLFIEEPYDENYKLKIRHSRRPPPPPGCSIRNRTAPTLKS